MSYLNKLHAIKAFVFDMDGVLTDGTVLVTEAGEQLRRFNIKDGYALQLAVRQGYKVAVISGGNSEGAKKRLDGLGIKDALMGVHDKVAELNRYLVQHNLIADEVVFMGDDMPDLEVLQLVGISACPADAVQEIKAQVLYVSDKNGGQGCVRDIIEKVMRVQGKWQFIPTIASK